jgi:c-di-GMP-related signal transduction protein
MVSLFPAMLQVPMDQITPLLPLRGQIRDSLNGTANLERRLLSWLEAHESGDWDGSDAIAQAGRLNREMLFRFYAEAVPWAEAALRSATS